MKYIFANWKMYLDFAETEQLVAKLLKEKFSTKKLKLAVFPTILSLASVARAMDISSFAVGAQNVQWTPKGAYTGAVSALLVKEAGAEYALVGHSERRHIFGESDTDVRKKIEACLDAGLVPVVCIGETKEEKDNGKREYRLKKQLMKAFENLGLKNNEIIVAYEPVWAIGTGDACNPLEAGDIQKWVKKEINGYLNQDVPVLYGGSVNEKNAASYTSLESIDGVLVGGASAKIETFVPLIKAVERALI